MLTVSQTISERLVEKVDDTIKPQIIHWAAYYVSLFVNLPSICLIIFAGVEDADGIEENFPYRGVHREDYDVSKAMSVLSSADTHHADRVYKQYTL